MRPSREHYEIRRTVEWLRRGEFIATSLAWLAVSFVGLFSINQVLVYFGVSVLDKIATPFVLFVCLSIIVMLVRVVVHLLRLFPPVSTEGPIHDSEYNDSLIEMMKEAESHSRWAEIIKIGSALSDVLWFTSRKKLRFSIGRFVEVAARQSGDMYTLSATLIEDLGNTIFTLGQADEGIKYIRQGIKVAEENRFYFLMSRGYRNLAACYIKNDPNSAEANLQKAAGAAQLIVDDANKYDALGSIEYARSRLLEQQRRFRDAIQALDNAIGYYRTLTETHPEAKRKSDDRLVKIYREKGVVYLSMFTEESIDDAYAALMSGLRLAQETLNYDNIVRCCSLLAKIQIQRKALDAAEGMINIARACINKVDTPSVIQEYNQVVRQLELEKHAS